MGQTKLALRNCFLLIILFTISSLIIAQRNENLNVLESWHGGTPLWIEWSNGKYMLVHHLNKQAFNYLDKRDQDIAELGSKPEWIKRQREIKEIAMEIIGPFPEKTDLNPISTGVIKKDGYRIEKIIYESLPRFYVTACMFIPDGITSPTPAIIHVSGHSDLSFRSPGYQQAILNLVKKGFIVFAIDPISQGERRQYPEDKFVSIVGKGGVTLRHNYLGLQAFISGISPVRYWIWDGIRAVDYLLTRPEVDSERIGIHGLSGGGLQSLVIPAFDERILASAPQNNVSSVRRTLQDKGPSDAENNIYHGIKNGFTESEFLQLRVPKPSIIVATTRDNKTIQGTRETYQEVLNAYRIFGKEDNFLMVEDHAYHTSTQRNRESVYSFFQKHLKLPGSPYDEDVEYLEPEELKVTPTGQVLTYLGGETVFSLNKKDAEKLIEKIEISRKNITEHLLSVQQKAKELSGFVSPYEHKDVVFRGGYQRDGYSIEMYGLQGEGDYIIPLLLFIPDGAGDFPAIIYIHPEGKSADAAPGGRIEKLVKQGFIVAALDPLGIGETEDKSWATYAVGIQTGKSTVGIQAGDINRVAFFLENRDNVQNENISAIAFESMCPALIHASAFNQTIRRVALVGSLISYKSIVMNQYYRFDLLHSTVPGVLTAYDLPDLLGCIAPRKLMLIELMDQMSEPASKSIINEELEFPRRVYSASGVSENLKIIDYEKSIDFDSFTNWWIK